MNKQNSQKSNADSSSLTEEEEKKASYVASLQAEAKETVKRLRELQRLDDLKKAQG